MMSMSYHLFWFTSSIIITAVRAIGTILFAHFRTI